MDFKFMFLSFTALNVDLLLSAPDTSMQLFDTVFWYG